MDKLNVEDRLEIHELLSRYGHVIDRKQWDRLGEIFTPDATIAMRTPESPDTHFSEDVVMDGLDNIRDTYAAVPNHRDHFVSNVVIESVDGSMVRTLCKYFGPTHTGEMFSGEFEDEVVRTPEGWRFRSRVLIPRSDPGLPPADE